MVTGTTTNEAPSLAFVLWPIDVAEFFATSFERAPVHIARGNANYFGNLYSVADVETALHVGGTDVTRFAMAKNGTLVDGLQLRRERTNPRARFTNKPPVEMLDGRTIAATFVDGATLLINDAARFSPRLQGLCNGILRETLIYAQANVYLTPPNERGFGIHHDTHDTLVLQIEGKKRWRVRDPIITLPIESQPLTNGREVGAIQNFDLEPGDTLYVPRGFRHDCIAAQTRSLHVTLALLPARTIELAEAALAVAATIDVELRRALPLGWQDDPDLPERIGALVAERVRAAFTKPVMNAARDLVLNDVFSTTRAGAEGTFDGAAALATLGPSSRISLRADAPLLLRPVGTDVHVVVPGKATTLPAACGIAIRSLQAGPRTLAEVDAIIPGQGAALVRLLVLDGLATIDA